MVVHLPQEVAVMYFLLAAGFKVYTSSQVVVSLHKDQNSADHRGLHEQTPPLQPHGPTPLRC